MILVEIFQLRGGLRWSEDTPSHIYGYSIAFALINGLILDTSQRDFCFIHPGNLYVFYATVVL